MEISKKDDKKKTGKIKQLKGENQDLKEEKKSDKSDIVNLEQEIELKKRYEESQQRFETIFYQSKEGNKIISSDLFIVQVNKVLPKMLGYTEKEMLGAKATKYAHPDFVHHWHELRDSLWKKKIPSFQIETCLVKKDGSSIWCQVSSIIFRDNGTDMGYTRVEDISKRKEYEAELKKLNDYQETLMHMVAHDLKGPVSNIKSLSGFLNKNLEKSSEAGHTLKEKNLTYVQMISDTCDKAQAIIRDLLFVGDFKSKATLKKTDLKIFIEAQLKILGGEAQKKEIAINFHFPEKPVHAHINHEKFARVLENLLSNAVKFTNVGGKITMSLKNKGEKVILQVKDNGIGIPDNLKASIFDKFTKANRKGTQGETTTGLGLYIVKQIVDIHHGKIWVESQENEGTSFFIELI